MCIVDRLDSGEPGIVSSTSVGLKSLLGCPEDGFTEEVDAMGAFIVPGFTDAHGHFISEGFRLNTPWLFDCASVEEVVQTLQAWVEEHPLGPGEWLQGQGWDQSKWGDDDTFPTKEDLDGAFPDNPLYLGRYDGHAIWVNSATLGSVPPLPASDPAGGVVVRDPTNGEPTGVLTDNAMALVADFVPAPSQQQMSAALEAVLKEAASLGVTGVTDMGSPDNWIDGPLLAWALAGNLTVRLEVLRLAVDTEMGPGSDPATASRYAGVGMNRTLSSRGVKFFLDGALGSWGAALLQPYTDQPNSTGYLRMDPADFEGNGTLWADRGWQLATHAIGDRANRLALDVYEAVLKRQAQPKDRRFRIEHSQILNCSDVGRFSELGVVASMQPTHAMEDMAFAADRVGAGRLTCAYAPSTLLGQPGALPVPFGSDFPVEPLDPRFGLYSAVTRQNFYPGDDHGTPSGGWYPEQCLAPIEALRGFTSSAAFASFDEGKLGTLGVGKWADFVLLSKDVVQLRGGAEDLVDTQVLKTFLGGRKVFDIDDDDDGGGGDGGVVKVGGRAGRRKGKRPPVPVMPNSAVAEDGATQTPGMWVVGRR